MVLRIISLLALLITLIYIIRYFRTNQGSGEDYKSWIKELKLCFSKDWKSHWQSALYFLTFSSIIVLAFTGFIPYLLLGKPLGGCALMLHVVFSLLFAIPFTILVLLWVGRFSFNLDDWITLKNLFKNSARSSGNVFLQKIYLWIIVIFSILATSMVFSMYPIFGTIGQEFLLKVHRFSTVGLFIFFVLFSMGYKNLSKPAEK